MSQFVSHIDKFLFGKLSKSFFIFINVISLFVFISCNKAGPDSQFGVKPDQKIVNGPLGNSALTFAPASYDFGIQNINSGTYSHTVTVTNASAFTITISGMTI